MIAKLVAKFAVLALIVAIMSYVILSYVIPHMQN